MYYQDTSGIVILSNTWSYFVQIITEGENAVFLSIQNTAWESAFLERSVYSSKIGNS